MTTTKLQAKRTTKQAAKSTRRAPRSIGLTMLGQAAVWHFEQAEALAARPADATAPCALCDHVYAVAGLDTLSDYTAEQAAPDYGFSPDTLLCRDCRAHLEAEFGTERPRNFEADDTFAFHRLIAQEAQQAEDFEVDMACKRDMRDEGRGIFY